MLDWDVEGEVPRMQRLYYAENYKRRWPTICQTLYILLQLKVKHLVFSFLFWALFCVLHTYANIQSSKQ